MEKGKINIVRSFSEKVNLGDFQNADIFASRSYEVEVGTPLQEQEQISAELHALCLADVQKDKQEYLGYRQEMGKGMGYDKMIDMIDKISVGNPGALDDFISSSKAENKMIQSVKRAYNRSPLKKEQ
jgi:hypothetical protein